MRSSSTSAEFHFLTLFSESYLPQAHVLLSSIFDAYPHAKVMVCNLDEGASRVLSRFPDVSIFSLSEVLEHDSKLAAICDLRIGASRIFSSVPSIALRALQMIPRGHSLVYLDADTALLGDIEPIQRELGDNSVGLFPHNFLAPARKLLDRYGVFNAGAFVVRNSSDGVRFLEAWRELCIDWCDDRLSGKRYSNQAYLTHLFKQNEIGMKSLGSSGGNIAPWNLGITNFSITSGRPHVSGVAISFFHFHGLNPGLSKWTLGHLRYLRLAPKSAIRSLYVPYVTALMSASEIYGIQLKRSQRFSGNFLGTILSFLLQAASYVFGQTFSIRELQDGINEPAS